MSNEAQPQTDDDLGVVLETGEPEAELAPAEQAATDETGQEAPAEPETPEGFISAEVHQKEVNKQHWKYREEERARQKVEQENERLARELEELKAAQVDTTIPPVPDPYDEDFATKMAERDEALQRAATHNTAIQQKEQEQQQAAQQAELDREAAEKAKVDVFDSNMVNLGLSPAEVKKAADTIVEYGVSDNMSDVILLDEDGPLMVTYLAQNPLELSELNSMNVVQLASKLPELKQKASLLKPKTSQAPEPPEVLKGAGVPEAEDPLLKGVTFE